MIAFSIFLIMSCSEQHDNNDGQLDSTSINPINTNIPHDSTLKPSSHSGAVQQEVQFNFTDSAGLKQGLWQTFHNKKLTKLENYVDGLLHGKQREYLGDGGVRETNYEHGIQHGYYLDYKVDSTAASYVSYWENGVRLWSAFPWELESYIVTVKGFLTSQKEVYIKVPYNSGKLMYEGKLVTDDDGRCKAVGVHKAYYETGEIKSTVDYNIDSIFIFDQNGHLLLSEKTRSWRGRRHEELLVK